jgi:phthalate 4,5-dioxygenase oxygenase subunit
MITHEENILLCQVEKQAPAGQMMRRHWIPVCLLEEVSEADGTPVKARILGEDLVVFRDSDGQVGVIDEKCPHRGASLLFGRNEEGGLRCLYHGWKVAVDGEVLEMPSEPAGACAATPSARSARPASEGIR